MSQFPNDLEMLESSAEVPAHVVHRAFVNETVVLNLQSGKYHGLNPTAGNMLEALEHQETVRQAALTLADHYNLEPEQMEQDVCTFVRDMLARGLLVLRVSAP